MLFRSNDTPTTEIYTLSLHDALPISGLALLVLRETGTMVTLLVVHLGVVLALFVTLPYGKFVHGLYRAAALVKSANESSRE